VHIQIEKFEGPMALLLHLIRKEEMDIFDINIHHITAQYLAYIKVMKKLDLEVAGEFIAMASTLIHIKSKMLLPQYDDDGEIIESEDPRKELVQKLIEYQKFQEASEKLYARSLVGRDVWLRGAKENLNDYRPEEEIILEDNPLFSLIAAYRFTLKNMKKTVHRVMKEMQSISERVMELKSRLVRGRTVRFYQLIDATGEYRQGQVLITFLSMLELAKIGFVSLFQGENFSEIHVTPLKEIDHNVIERVEDYESANLGDEAIQSSLFDAPLENKAETTIDVSLDDNEFNDSELNESDSEASPSQDKTASLSVVQVVQSQDETLPEEIASDDDIEQEELRIKLLDEDKNDV